MPTIDTTRVVDMARDLEPLPMTVVRLARLVSDPDSKLRDIVETIALDPPLTAKVLRVANSAASGVIREITTVDQAVVRIGTGPLLSMAIAAGVQASMLRPLPSLGLDPEELWEHSVAAALAAESLMGLTERTPPPESFSAALLHDIGKLVLGHYLMKTLDGQWPDEGFDITVAEVECGVEHAELGAMVVEHWKLPHTIAEAIRYHHSPYRAVQSDVDPDLPWIVHLADLVACSTGRSAAENPPSPDEIHRALSALAMDEAQFEKLLFRTNARLSQVAQRFA